MPKQTDSQKIGSLGQSIVELQVKASTLWIARKLDEDFGIDLELEFAPSDVSGKFIKVQIKSHEKIDLTKDYASEPLTKSFLRYVYECKVPIILIVTSIEENKSWYVWLQKWLLESGKYIEIYNEIESKTLSIPVHFNNELKNGLLGDLISIALWENKIQLAIAVRDLANLSLKLYNDRLAQMLFGYINELTPQDHSPNYLDSIITRVLDLGTNIWATSEGNDLSSLLFDFIRSNGEKLNSNHIYQLVVRGESYSRTGINALGILYDNYPKHAQSLNLIEKFKNFDPRVYYYCSIREKYIGQKSPKWFMDKTNDLQIENIKTDFEGIPTSILDKWANRGDSAILDYLTFNKI